MLAYTVTMSHGRVSRPIQLTPQLFLHLRSFHMALDGSQHGYFGQAAAQCVADRSHPALLAVM